jgi:hypothetical protein
MKAGNHPLPIQALPTLIGGDHQGMRTTLLARTKTVEIEEHVVADDKPAIKQKGRARSLWTALPQGATKTHRYGLRKHRSG